MGLTLAQVSANLAGQRREVVVDFTFDSSYPTGGESLTPALLGLARVEYVLFPESPDGYEFLYDRANEKLLAYQPGGDLDFAFADGQDGGSDATYDVTGVAVGDHLVAAIHYTTKASIASQADVTSSFAITAADVITDGGPADYSNDQLLFLWRKAKREVPNATSLATVNGRLVAVGY